MFGTRGLLVAALLVVGCTRGKSDEEKAAETPKPEVQKKPAFRIDPNWLEGTLPAGIAEGTPVDGGTLVVRINAEPPSLCSLLDSDFWGARIIRHNVSETLVRPDPRDHPRYQIIPELAESWEEAPDHLTFTFHLRKGVKFHDGQPFTAKDVKATFERILDPKVRAQHIRQAFVDLASVTIPDDFTVVLKWKKPYVWALRKLADVLIVPAHVLAEFPGEKFNTAPFLRKPIGTGPFRFDSWEEGKAITLSKNPDYWGNKAHVEKLVFRIVVESNVAQQLWMREEIDEDISLSSEQYADIEKEPKLVETYHRVKVFPSGYSWIGWNMARPLFQDRNVRRALNMLFDRETIRTTLQKGIPVSANCIHYHLGSGCDPSTQQVGFDPATAMELLRGSGWADTDGDGILDKGGKPFKFSMSLPPGVALNEQMMLVFKEQLRKIGIEMEIHKIEWAVYIGKLRQHDFDACYLAWNAEEESDPYEIWHSTQKENGSNWVSYKNSEADALILQIRAEFDREKRNVLSRKLNQIVIDDAPYVFLYHMPKRTLLHRKVKGAYDSPIESFQFRDMWMDPTWKSAHASK